MTFNQNTTLGREKETMRRMLLDTETDTDSGASRLLTALVKMDCGPVL